MNENWITHEESVFYGLKQQAVLKYSLVGPVLLCEWKHSSHMNWDWLVKSWYLKKNLSFQQFFSKLIKSEASIWGQLFTCRCIKTTDPRSLHVPPCRSTCSMRKIWRKRIPLWHVNPPPVCHDIVIQFYLHVNNLLLNKLFTAPDGWRGKHLAIRPDTEHNDGGNDHY